MLLLPLKHTPLLRAKQARAWGFVDRPHPGIGWQGADVDRFSTTLTPLPLTLACPPPPPASSSGYTDNNRLTFQGQPREA